MLSRFMTRREQLVLFFLGCSILVGAAVLYLSRVSESDPIVVTDHEPANEVVLPTDSKKPDADPEDSTELLVLVVSIQGAVQFPGVYRFSSDGRVADAIESSGGVEPLADTSSINLAARLVDGSTLYIPSRRSDDEKQLLTNNHGDYVLGGGAVGSPTASHASQPTRININTATAVELESLPGIGPTYASAIMVYRNKQMFRRVEEIMEVRGIGEKRFEDIRDMISVR